jgi:hypothetical protein
VLVLDAGSSRLEFSGFDVADGEPRAHLAGDVEAVTGATRGSTPRTPTARSSTLVTPRPAPAA